MAEEPETHLLAVAFLLEAAPPTVPLLVRTSSEYTFNVCARWIRGWSERDWTRKDGRPIANRELVQRVWTAMQPRRYTRFEMVEPGVVSDTFIVASRLAGKAADRVASSGRVSRVGPGWPTI